MTFRSSLSPATTITKNGPDETKGPLPITQLPIGIINTAYNWYIHQLDYTENDVSRFCRKILSSCSETKADHVTTSQLNELVALLVNNIKDSQLLPTFDSALVLNIFLACALTARYHDDRPLYSIQKIDANEKMIFSSYLCAWRFFCKKRKILEAYGIANPENISALLSDSRLSLFQYENMLKKYPGISQTIFNASFFIHDSSISDYCNHHKLNEYQCKILCDYIIDNKITDFYFKSTHTIFNHAQAQMKMFLTHLLCATNKTSIPEPLAIRNTASDSEPHSTIKEGEPVIRTSSLSIFATNSIGERRLIDEILKWASLTPLHGSS